MTKTTRQRISVRIGRKTYTGSRVIEGTRKLYQTIHYKGKSVEDHCAYRPGERQKIIKYIAGALLEGLAGRAKAI